MLPRKQASLRKLVFWKQSININKPTKVKSNQLCFRCLNGNHVEKDCKYSRICDINDCTDTHNRLLHKEKPVNRSTSSGMTEETHRKGRSLKLIALPLSKLDVERADFVSFRTFPVVLKNGQYKFVVNALLDDRVQDLRQ